MVTKARVITNLNPRLLAILAEGIARVAFLEETDLQGQPYIDHVARVAAAVSDTDAKLVAWLHDVLEDTELTAVDLQQVGFPDHIVSAVLVVTKWVGETYQEYISRVLQSRNELAITVKEADIRDNLRAGVPASLERRYVAALERIAAYPGGVEDGVSSD